MGLVRTASFGEQMRAGEFVKAACDIDRGGDRQADLLVPAAQRDGHVWEARHGVAVRHGDPHQIVGVVLDRHPAEPADMPGNRIEGPVHLLRLAEKASLGLECTAAHGVPAEALGEPGKSAGVAEHVAERVGHPGDARWVERTRFVDGIAHAPDSFSVATNGTRLFRERDANGAVRRKCTVRPEAEEAAEGLGPDQAASRSIRWDGRPVSGLRVGCLRRSGLHRIQNASFCEARSKRTGARRRHRQPKGRACLTALREGSEPFGSQLRSTSGWRPPRFRRFHERKLALR